MLAAVPAKAADVKELFAVDLADYPGKEGRVIEVSYPPGTQDMVHRHDAHAFVYVLEGQIIMQVKGQPAVTLKAGQTFYEGPTDVHIVGRNASTTEPARFVVVLLKGRGSHPYAGERVMLGTGRPDPLAVSSRRQPPRRPRRRTINRKGLR
jgi:quercetin dioxygenase-like cupin family protein